MHYFMLMNLLILSLYHDASKYFYRQVQAYQLSLPKFHSDIAFLISIYISILCITHISKNITLTITFSVSMAINMELLDNIDMISSNFLLVKTSSMEIIACSFVVHKIDKEGQRRAFIAS